MVLVHHQGLGNRAEDGHPRVERLIGILEHDLHMTTVGPQFRRTELAQVDVIQKNAPLTRRAEHG